MVYSAVIELKTLDVVILCVLSCAVFRSSEMASGLGIAFCGNNLHVSSVVLHAEVSQPADVEKCLQRLGSAGTPRRGKSIGLMFACVGRGHRFYNGTVGVESSIFKRLYPGVPLFGFFGNGEIGYNFPLSTDSRRASEDMEAGRGDDGDGTFMPQIYHSFTTIFVLMRFDS